MRLPIEDVELTIGGIVVKASYPCRVCKRTISILTDYTTGGASGYCPDCYGCREGIEEWVDARVPKWKRWKTK